MRSFVLAATAVLGIGFGPRPATVTAPPTVVLLVRHAEKAAQPAQDPPLTDAGSARARALVAVARDAGVSAIITTQFLRTKNTAEPTATALTLSFGSPLPPVAPSPPPGPFSTKITNYTLTN